MNKKLFINKVKQEINDKYNKVCNKKGIENKYIINYESRLKDIKEIKDFKRDVLRIEEIMIRDPIEDDLKVNCLEVPEIVYECLIVKSTNNNKYYKLSFTDFKEEYLKDIIENKDFIINNKRKHYYILDIKNKIEYDYETDIIDYNVILN